MGETEIGDDGGCRDASVRILGILENCARIEASEAIGRVSLRFCNWFF